MLIANPTEPICPERRRFLQQLGSTALLAPLAPLASYAAVAAPACRVGVLLPTSVRYPQLATDFQAGLTQALAGQAAAVQLVHTFNYGLRFNHGLHQAARWVTAGEVDLLVGVTCRNHAAWLRPTLETHAVPLLVCDAGANQVRADRQSPYVLRHSLGSWQSSYAAGYWAATHYGPRALLAVDMFENGYDLPSAFQAGFYAAGGHQLVTHLTTVSEPQTLTALATQIRRTQPQVVYALYSGQAAAEFLAFYQHNGLDSVAPLMSNGLLPASVPTGTPSPELLTVSGWPVAAQTAPFALLGYEAALRITQALTHATHGAALATALANTAIDGPRGSVTPDPARMDVVHGHWLHSPTQTQPLALTVQPTLPVPAHSGWINPYLIS